jgi:hypothetical protein
MNLAQLIRILLRMGFIDPNPPGAYRETRRLSHPSVNDSSVFVGDGPDVTYGGQTTALPPLQGRFLIANGRGQLQGMARALRALATPTGAIPDPQHRQPSTDDDPYWRGHDLANLLAQMPAAAWARVLSGDDNGDDNPCDDGSDDPGVDMGP